MSAVVFPYGSRTGYLVRRDARCVECDKEPTAPDVAELIETDELCPGCRAEGLREQADKIRDAVKDLVRDSLKLIESGHCPVEVEELVTHHALILEPTAVALPADVQVSIQVPGLSPFREQLHHCTREADGRWRAQLMTGEPIAGGDPWGTWITATFTSPGEAVAWLREKAATTDFRSAFNGRD